MILHVSIFTLDHSLWDALDLVLIPRVIQTLYQLLQELGKFGLLFSFNFVNNSH
jgi:hypothetical protein